jgi:O-antigen ligase
MNPATTGVQPARFPNLVSVGNPFQAIGFGILLVFLFILFSRTFDVVLSSLQIPFTITVLVLAATVFSGGILRVWNHRIGRLLLAFTAWMAIGIPFSFWPGGSIATLQNWLKAFVVYICIVGLIATFDQTLRAIKVLAFSVVVLAFLALFLGNTDSGRLFLSEGKFQNPNDLAQIMLMGLPFLFLIVRDSAQNILFRIPSFLLSGVVFFIMLKTGSRGAIFGFVALLAFIFFQSNMTERMVLVALSLFMVVFAAAIVPASLRSRYTTLFSSESDDSGENGQLSEIAVASAEARQRVLGISIDMTLHHPIFGVGPGMFAEAVEDDFKQQGKRTTFLLTHNSYTQVSSEMGFPGLFLYLSVIVCSFKATSAVIRMGRSRPGKRWTSISNTAAALRMSLVAFAVTALFSSVAYQSLLPVVAGLCTALYLSVQDELADEANIAASVALQSPVAVGPTRPTPRLQTAGWQRS